MNFELESTHAVKILAFLDRFYRRKSTIPVIACAHFFSNNGKLSVSVTDLETYAVVDTDVPVSSSSGTDQVCADFKMVKDMVKNLSNGIIKFSSNKKGVTISSGKKDVNLSIMDCGDFPDEIELKGTRTVVELDSANFIFAFNHIKSSLSNDEARMQLTMAQLELKNDTLSLTSTDRFSLANYIGTCKFDGSSSLLLKRNVGESVSSLDGDKFVLTFTEDAYQVMSSNGMYRITTTVNKDGYPDWRSLFPKSFAQTHSVATKELKSNLKIVVGMDASVARFALAESMIMISCISEYGSYEGVVPCTSTGGIFTSAIGFNPKLISRILDNDTSAVDISVNKSTMPVLITSSDLVGFRFIIMPIHTGE